MIPDNLGELLKGQTLPTEKKRESDNAELLVLRTLKDNSTSCQYYDQAEFFNWLYQNSPTPEDADVEVHRGNLLHPIIGEVQLPPGGNKGLKDWSSKDQFTDSKNTSWADILCVSNSSCEVRPILPDVIDVKTTGMAKGGGNNGVSLDRIETLCRNIHENPEAAENYNHHFVALHLSSNKVVKAEVHDWFRFDWKSVSSMTGGMGQWQPNPFNFNQDFNGTKIEWAESCLDKLRPARARRYQIDMAKLHSIVGSSELRIQTRRAMQEIPDYVEFNVENDADYSDHNAINKQDLLTRICIIITEAGTKSQQEENWESAARTRADYITIKLDAERVGHPSLFDKEIGENDIRKKLESLDSKEFFEAYEFLVDELVRNEPDYLSEQEEYLLEQAKQMRSNRPPFWRDRVFQSVLIAAIGLVCLIYLFGGF